MKPWYRSKKLWVAVGTVAVLALDSVLGLGMDATTKSTIASVATGYVIGQGIADRPTSR